MPPELRLIKSVPGSRVEGKVQRPERP